MDTEEEEAELELLGKGGREGEREGKEEKHAYRNKHLALLGLGLLY